MTPIKKHLFSILGIFVALFALIFGYLSLRDDIHRYMVEKRLERRHNAYYKTLQKLLLNDGAESCYNVIILDASGSMAGLEEATIAGANETINTIKAAADSLPSLCQYITIASFAGSLRMMCDLQSVSDVKSLTRDDYVAIGKTALYDAVGFMVEKMSKIVPEESTALITIITDGYENASETYIAESVKDLVKKCEDKGWTFSYIGANQDAIAEAAKIGITNAMQYKSDIEGTHDMYRKDHSSRALYYSKRSRAKTLDEKKDAGKGYYDNTNN